MEDVGDKQHTLLKDWKGDVVVGGWRMEVDGVAVAVGVGDDGATLKLARLALLARPRRHPLSPSRICGRKSP